MNEFQSKIALKQLTGRDNPMNTLKAMIGASGFSLQGNAVLFMFKMFRKANVCRLELDEGADVYNLIFQKLNKTTYNLDTILRFDGLYADQLKETFETTTGLRLSL